MPAISYAYVGIGPIFDPAYFILHITHRKVKSSLLCAYECKHVCISAGACASKPKRQRIKKRKRTANRPTTATATKTATTVNPTTNLGHIAMRARCCCCCCVCVRVSHEILQEELFCRIPLHARQSKVCTAIRPFGRRRRLRCSGIRVGSASQMMENVLPHNTFMHRASTNITCADCSVDARRP